MQQTSFADNQIQIAMALPIDSSNKPGTINGAPSVSSDDTQVVTASTDPTGLTITLAAVSPGTANVTLAGNTSAGNFSTPFGVTITGGPAVGFVFTFAPPTAP